MLVYYFIAFTVSGSELSITSAGVLTFASAPDYETKTSYTATVTATDGTNSTTQSITVNVTNLNDNSPAFTHRQPLVRLRIRPVSERLLQQMVTLVIPLLSQYLGLSY